MCIKTKKLRGCISKKYVQKAHELGYETLTDFIIVHYVEGKQTQDSVAKILGCSSETVGRWGKMAGAKLRGKKMIIKNQGITSTQICKMLETMSYREVAEKIGCSGPGVYRMAHIDKYVERKKPTEPFICNICGKESKRTNRFTRFCNKCREFLPTEAAASLP